MPGLIRELLIFSTNEGLIIKPQSSVEHSSSLRLDYGSRALTLQTSADGDALRRGPHIESYGIIGRTGSRQAVTRCPDNAHKGFSPSHRSPS